MRLGLVGHRGVGKSSLLGRLREYLPEIESKSFVCLDEYLARHFDIEIQTYFESHGEEAFRALEKKAFQKLQDETRDWEALIVAFGAGFGGRLPEDWGVLWVQRDLDLSRHFFVDRPALDSPSPNLLQGMDPIRFQERESRYKDISDGCWLLEEHHSKSMDSERQWARRWVLSRMGTRGTKTGSLDLPENLYYTLADDQDALGRESFPQLELRDDLLSPVGFEKALKRQNTSFLLSFRKKDVSEQTAQWISRVAMWDWPIEFGDCPYGAPSIWSLHQREPSLEATFQRFQGKDGLCKLAVPIHSFDELIQGHAWWEGSPNHRVFLPSSPDGRWQWYRRWMSSRLEFQFFRTCRGEVRDQPSLMQALHTLEGESFAGVLGAPVCHSLTPTYHRYYFDLLNMPTFAIPIGEKEWSADLMDGLQSMGLRCAAVTSPLKGKAGQLVGQQKPINTLVWSDGWIGTNTDEDGLSAWSQRLSGKQVALWGGGGTLFSLSNAFPSLVSFSSRTGALRGSEMLSSDATGDYRPDVVIWAVGRHRFESEGVFPPDSWKPKAVYDLNYSEDSPGILCAQRYACEYINGIEMFEAQAKEQQKFWSLYVSQ